MLGWGVRAGRRRASQGAQGAVSARNNWDGSVSPLCACALRLEPCPPCRPRAHALDLCPSGPLYPSNLGPVPCVPWTPLRWRHACITLSLTIPRSLRHVAPPVRRDRRTLALRVSFSFRSAEVRRGSTARRAPVLVGDRTLTRGASTRGPQARAQDPVLRASLAACFFRAALSIPPHPTTAAPGTSWAGRGEARRGEGRGTTRNVRNCPKGRGTSVVSGNDGQISAGVTPRRMRRGS